MILVLDIDGTIADIDHRLHFVDKNNPSQEDWDNFFDPILVSKDTPIEFSRYVFEIFLEYFDDIIFLTGRPEELRDVTVDWLTKHYDISPDEDHLLMRPDSASLTDDQSAWANFKKVVFEDELIPRYGDADFIIIDDTNDILAMLAPYGITLKAPECWKLLMLER
jgi:hypothetical protein